MADTVINPEQTQNQGPDLKMLERMAFMESTPAPAAAQEPVVVTPEPQPIVDKDGFLKSYLKEKFGAEDESVILTEWQQLQALKANPPSAEIKFANDESRKWHEYITEGKEDDLYNSLQARQQLKNLDTMNDEQKLKLYIKMTNPLYDQELVDAVYARNYNFNEAAFKDEDGLIADPLAFKLAKIDALQKAQQDTQKAGEYFTQFKQKIELQPIKKDVDEDYQQFKASNAEQRETYEKNIAPALNSLTENDIPLAFSVNDANNQMQFDVNLAVDKQDFDQVRKDALDYGSYLRNNFYDAEGKFLANKFARAITLEKNFDKYAQSIARQAVNAERKRVLGKETPVVDLQRNFALEEKDELKELEKKVFFGQKQ